MLIDSLDEYRMLDRKDDYTEEDQDLLQEGESDDVLWGQSAWISNGHAEIAKLLSNFTSSSNVKVIVSSRELVTFEDAFRTASRVKIHEHTTTAISNYCRTHLEPQSYIITNIDYFIYEITNKSHGVSL